MLPWTGMFKRKRGADRQTGWMLDTLISLRSHCTVAATLKGKQIGRENADGMEQQT